MQSAALLVPMPPQDTTWKATVVTLHNLPGCCRFMCRTSTPTPLVVPETTQAQVVHRRDRVALAHTCPSTAAAEQPTITTQMHSHHREFYRTTGYIDNPPSALLSRPVLHVLCQYHQDKIQCSFLVLSRNTPGAEFIHKHHLEPHPPRRTTRSPMK